MGRIHCNPPIFYTFFSAFGGAELTHPFTPESLTPSQNCLRVLTRSRLGVLGFQSFSVHLVVRYRLTHYSEVNIWSPEPSPVLQVVRYRLTHLLRESEPARWF